MNDQPTRESRSVSFVDAEVKGMNLRGYAAVFDTPWDQRLTDAMGYAEETARGTFRRALSSNPNVPLLWQHDRRDLLASTHGGTMKLKEDGKGLLVEAKLPSSPLGEHVREMIHRGDVKGMSYGIETLPADSEITRKNGLYHRIIRNARSIIDTTLTWEPAYSATSVELRTLAFVAQSLQALVPGVEAQIDQDAVTDTPESAAWLADNEDFPSEQTETTDKPARRRPWEIVIDELEKEGI